MSLTRRVGVVIFGVFIVLQWVACSPFWAGRPTAQLQVDSLVDSLTVDPVLVLELDGALQAARWRWLRARKGR